MSYSYDRRPLYHGTYHDYEKPKLNRIGILWLTPNPRVAAQYALTTWSPTKGKGFVWEVLLKSSARIVDLADLSHPVIRELYESLNDIRKHVLGPVSEDSWRAQADFGIFEAYPWTVRFLKSKRIDGATCADRVSTMPIPHDSVALFKLSVIQSVQRVAVDDRGRPEIIGDIQKHIEGWKPGDSF